MSEITDLFNVRARIRHFAGIFDDYRAASERVRSALPGRWSVPYGDHPDETLDLVFPTAAPPVTLRPVHVFVHGGYWHQFTKESFTFVAETITAAGAIAAILDYSPMPQARMATLVGQVRGAVAWLVANAADFGGDPARLSVSGHSAGAHLASYLNCRGPADDSAAPPLAPIRALLLVSGLYDLAPIAASYLQPRLALTAKEVVAWSPCRSTPSPGPAICLAVGQAETSPFYEQARAFATHLETHGISPRFETLPGENHLTVVRSLGIPGQGAATLLAAAISTGPTAQGTVPA